MMPLPMDHLDPTALDGSPGHAFASHATRANGIARYFASTHSLSAVSGEAGENETVTLIAHLHAAEADPTFTVGDEASITAAPKALRTLKQKNRGLVGTDGASTKRDYDMTLKGLMVIAYRYRHLLRLPDEPDGSPGFDGFNFILDKLVPGHMSGGHRPEIEIVEQTFLNIDTPETENHLLMIESSRYLINQLLHDRAPGDAKFDNSENGNGLSRWLLGYLQRVAKHDFLEFNSRPYARMSLHSLFNLHEFARDKEIRTASQILLDYTMVKFAVSSNRGRRVSPFRRHQPEVNHQANSRNDLYQENGGDQVAGCFLAYTGLTDPPPGITDTQGKPGKFPAGLTFTGLIAATAAYRPPPAAYVLALNHNNPASLHQFYHGARPQLPASNGDAAEGGLEIYYRSPSFLLSAGGSFLNSGYGRDEIDIGEKRAWNEASRAQAITLIPTRVDTKFHDLIRFEPYPDPIVDPYTEILLPGQPPLPGPHTLHTRSVNIGVNRGLAAGANLRPAEKKTIWEQSTSSSPVLAFHADRLLMAWRDPRTDNLHVAKVQSTSILGIDGVDGVEGVEDVGTLADTTDMAPALVSHNGRLFLAWKGSGNDNLNLTFSEDNGASFRGTRTFPETSSHGPTLTSHAGRLFLAWKGSGNEALNVAKVALFGNTAGGFGIEGLEDKVVLGETSPEAPALASHNGRLFIAWKGEGDDNLNLTFSEDNGASFRGTRTFPETSSHGPTLTSHAGRLFLAWKGSGNEALNVAKVALFGNTAGGFGIEGLEDKVVLGETSPEAPALASHNGRLFIAWKGEGDDNLNLRVSRDGAFQTAGPWLWSNLADLGFFVAAYRTPPARPDDLDTPLDNLALVYAMERDGMDFNTFKALTLDRNDHLPARLDYGSLYEFHTPDNKHFSILFSLTLQKYKARIVDLNDPIDDLSTLPLVRGKYLTAPGGHDGLIEIRHPGCDTPLVLDYRDAHNPVYQDNIAACPQPWIDRAKALMTFGEKLRGEGRDKEANAAFTESIKIYRQLAAINPGTYQRLLAQALHILIRRHIADGHPELARLVATEAIQAYRQLATTPGANSASVASNLINLSGELGAAHLDTESTAAAQAAADVKN